MCIFHLAVLNIRTDTNFTQSLTSDGTCAEEDIEQYGTH